MKSQFASEGDTSYSESICVEEGEYVFTVKDDLPYNAMASAVIMEKGATMSLLTGHWLWSEETRFLLPFIPGTNVTTQHDY